MTVLLKWALGIVLRWAYSLKREDLDLAYNYVLEAQKHFAAGGDKSDWVRAQLKQVLPKLQTRALNLLIELAVARFSNLGK